jgi:hypothetical protein
MGDPQEIARDRHPVNRSAFLIAGASYLALM